MKKLQSISHLQHGTPAAMSTSGDMTVVFSPNRAKASGNVNPHSLVLHLGKAILSLNTFQRCEGKTLFGEKQILQPHSQQISTELNNSTLDT